MDHSVRFKTMEEMSLFGYLHMHPQSSCASPNEAVVLALALY
jgi:hypothetical protein